MASYGDLNIIAESPNMRVMATTSRCYANLTPWGTFSCNEQGLPYKLLIYFLLTVANV